MSSLDRAAAEELVVEMIDLTTTIAATPPAPPPSSAASLSHSTLNPAVVDSPFVVRMDGIATSDRVSAGDIEQYMTRCGRVARVHLVEASPRHAMIYFTDERSVRYAQLLTGAAFKGKAITITPHCTDSIATEPIADDAVAATEPTRHPPADPSAAGVALKATTAVGASPNSFIAHSVAAVDEYRKVWKTTASDKMAQLCSVAYDVELSLSQAISNAMGARQPTPVYGNGPTREQYDFTATQPQWGRRPQ